MVTANAITDIYYYVVHKVVGKEKTLEAIRTLCSTLDITDVGKADILNAMELELPDFEDALGRSMRKAGQGRIHRDPQHLRLRELPGSRDNPPPSSNTLNKRKRGFLYPLG